MKFLAILRDSFREAVDAKVFYVMTILSVLLILATFSLGFEPRPADEFFAKQVVPTANIDLNELNFDQLKIALMTGQMSEAELARLSKKYENAGEAKLISLEALDAKGPKSPDSRYRLIIANHYQKPERAEEVRKNVGDLEKQLKERFGKFGEVQLVETKSVKYLPPGSPGLPKEVDPKDVYLEIETAPAANTRVLWPHELSLFFGLQPVPGLGSVPLGDWIFLLENSVVNGLGGWVTLLVSVVLTAFFIPNMLRKGTIDLLIVKPINRWTLLLMKYIGGLTFIFLNTTLAVSGTWLALGLKTGVWAPSFLLCIPMVTFFFAILYSVSTLLAVLTRSSIACIILTCLFWFVLWLVGVMYQASELFSQIETAKARSENREAGEENAFVKTIKVIHRVLPRTGDLDSLVELELRKDLRPDQKQIIDKLDIQAKQVSWGESISVSVIFVLLMLTLSCWLFSVKDY